MPLQRYYQQSAHRTRGFYNPVSGMFYSEVSKKHQIAIDAPLESILAVCDTRALFILPTAQGSYFTAKDFYAIKGLEVKRFLTRAKKFSSTVKPSAEVEYKGKVIAVYRVDTWIDYTPNEYVSTAINAYAHLEKIFTEQFQPASVHKGEHDAYRIELLASPGLMAVDLLKRTLPYNTAYPCIPDDCAQLYFDNSTQGHVETFYHGINTLDNLRYYDGRWMYASCLDNVPVGTPVHDHVNAYMPYVPGLYKAEVQVPETWAHIGLLPCRTAKGVVYPRTPGELFSTVCSASELYLAIENGWQVEIEERVLYPETPKATVKPLRALKNKLVYIRDTYALTLEEPYQSYVRDACRKMLLHLIGTFFSHTREVESATWDIDSIPDDSFVEELKDARGADLGLYRYTTQGVHKGLAALMCHPEWSWHIWGLARKKVAEQALTLPFDALVAIRVDGLWVNTEMGVHDTGKVGQFREKPLPVGLATQWPKTTSDMLKIVNKYHGVGGDN